jgi:rare lipoprotein A
MRSAVRALVIVSAGLLLGACGSREVQKPEQPPEPVPQPAPTDAAAIPDAVPRREPRSPFGNPVFYQVLGARYYVLADSQGYRERGVASWYGPGFHQGRTSSGETYDMNKMTAAHKTLPLPCFAQVTNLKNGKSVVVRINDRGPFVANRLIDLSYAAASKLDMLREGTTLVEVRTLEAPDTPAPAPVVAKGDLYIAAGAFTEERNAERMLANLRSAGIGPAFMREVQVGGRQLYRVRVGPVPDVAEFDRLVGELRGAGVADARLALD